MILTCEGHRACLGWGSLYIAIYTIISCIMYSLYGGMYYKNGVPSTRPYDSDIGMFVMSEKQYDDNGTLKERKEVSGYLMEIKISTCLFEKTDESCSVSYYDYPPAMTFVYLACFWLLVINLVFLSPVLALFVYKAKNTCHMRRRSSVKLFVGVFVTVCTVHVFGYFVYIHVIGKEVGFSWVHLTHAVYIGLIHACLSPCLAVLAFLICRKRSKGICTYHQSLVYVTYKKKKTKVRRKTEHRTSIQRSTSQIDAFFDFSLDTQDQIDFNNDIKSYIEKVWKPQKVGIGRDARGLYHSSINIIKVMHIGHESVFKTYTKRKKQVEDFAATVGGKLLSPESYSPGINPIQTVDLMKSSTGLGLSLNYDINEYYLFHGTPIANLSSIERHGFDIGKCRHSMLGRGIYFTEDPVKADQYTGKSSSDQDPFCCMLLCRVLIGDGVLQRHVGYPVISSSAFTPPCRKCLKPNLTCSCIHSTIFDSVMFEGKLFREFVVYENALTYPEFAVIYKRVKSKRYQIPIG